MENKHSDIEKTISDYLASRKRERYSGWNILDYVFGKFPIEWLKADGELVHKVFDAIDSLEEKGKLKQAILPGMGHRIFPNKI